MECHIFDSIMKTLKSETYNYVFRKDTGVFVRWGKDTREDPSFSPFGPEIADIEISTICHGVGKNPCEFCYKSNDSCGKYMSLEKFKVILDKLPKTLVQIAFGIGDIDSNPDMYSIFEHCRENGIVPNITINGARLTDTHIENLVKLCGAVAVSRYDPDICYNAVHRLTEAGLKQVNIHALLAQETYSECLQAVQDAATDSRLKGLNAIVFLALKPIGRGTCMTPMTDIKKYKKLIEHAEFFKIPFGFDSCSAPMFLKAVEDSPNYRNLEQVSEPCEACCFSIYINVDGMVYPCSFLEDRLSFMNVRECTDFVKDIWNSSEVNKFRHILFNTANSKDALKPGCRQCPIHDIYKEIEK